MTDGSSPCCGSPAPSGHNRYSLCNSCGSECHGCGGCGLPGDEDRAHEMRQSRDKWEAAKYEAARLRRAEEGP